MATKREQTIQSKTAAAIRYANDARREARGGRCANAIVNLMSYASAASAADQAMWSRDDDWSRFNPLMDRRADASAHARSEVTQLCVPSSRRGPFTPLSSVTGALSGARGRSRRR